MLNNERKLVNKITNFTKNDKFKTSITMFLLATTVSGIIWAIIMNFIIEDLSSRVKEENLKNTQLNEVVNYYRGEANRYKMVSEEYYELFRSCQQKE